MAMTICFVLILLLINSIMCLSLQDNIENVRDINCKIDQQFQSSFITSLVEQATEVIGCQSKSSVLQEVHVLSLRSSGFNSPVDLRNGFLPSISLTVLPPSKYFDFPNITFIILHSLTPVMWQINMQFVNNSTNFHIIVSKPSHVVPSQTFSLSRQKLPSIKRLPTWIKNNIGSITSFSSISVANKVTLFLGSEVHSSQKCDFNSKSPSLNIKASFIQPQPATGCSVSINQTREKKNHVLHVIELNSSVLNDDILIHLGHHEMQKEFSQNSFVEQNLVLVLKSHVPTEWIINSNGIQGTLHLIAEYPVHVRANPMHITATFQQKLLPSSSKALLNTIRNTYGTINTFMKTSKANRINIIVKGEKYALAKELLSFQLQKKMSLDCLNNKLQVIFPFDETLEIFTSTIGSHSKLSFITLNDHSCKAEINETHIILQSNWNNCGMKNIVKKDGVIFYNQVHFVINKYALGKKISSAPKHLITDDDDYISEYGSGSDDKESLHQKYSEENHMTYLLPFYCMQAINIEDLNPSHEKFELNVYYKKNFQQQIPDRMFPLNVIVHDHMFVEVIIKADSRLCIVVDECWLSKNKGFSRKNMKKHVLIKQGCAADLSVELLSKSHCGNLSPDAIHHMVQFSFQFSEDFINQYLYLHCHLTSCAMQDSKQLNQRQCINTENFCINQSLRPYLDTLQGKKYTLVTKGPFHVISKSHVEKKKGLFSFSKPVKVSKLPENFGIDYNFDKLTLNNKKASQQLILIGLSTEAVVGIAFASFIIGAGLMATLWFIHMHTEPNRRKQTRKQSSKLKQREGQELNFEQAECNDTSIPCSLKPTSMHICS